MTVEVNKEKLLKSLYNWGMFWDTKYPDLMNVDHNNVTKLDLDHKLAKGAILAWQLSDDNFDALSYLRYLRGIVHGEAAEVGPITNFMLEEVYRCPMPDHPPPENASFDYGDEGLNAAVESYREYANYVGGTGSWPKCDPERPDVHSTRVNVMTAKASAHQKGILAETLKMVEACEAEMGQAVRHILDGDPSKAEHDVRFEHIAGSTIGYAYFPQPNTCDQVVKARIDNTFNVNSFVFAELLVHEYKGHSDGQQHTRGGIMNASIGRPTRPPSWKGDPHEKTKKRYYGGVPVPPKDGPTPDDPVPVPPVGDYNGTFIFQNEIYKIKVFK